MQTPGAACLSRTEVAVLHVRQWVADGETFEVGDVRSINDGLRQRGQVVPTI